MHRSDVMEKGPLYSPLVLKLSRSEGVEGEERGIPN